MEDIQSWFQAEPPRPLIIKGPKSVGKTTLVTDFLSTYSGNKVYMNLELNPGLMNLIHMDNMESTISSIATYFDIDAKMDGIIIFDECQLCNELIPRIITFQSQVTNLRFIFISSYPLENLTRRFRRASDYTLIHIGPMNFDEFLEVSNNHWYISVIKEHFKSLKPIPDIVHNDILNLFYEYLLIGGMPAAINEYLAMESILNISEVHYWIQNHQLNSLRLHNSVSSYVKLESLYHTIDMQLSKKNKKFKYNIIRKGATRNQYLTETKTLEDYGLLLPCQPIDDKINGLKLYLYDVGILVSKAKMNTNLKELDTSSDLYKGILENYVAQNFTSKGYPLYFWESDSQAKIDFILSTKDGYVPVEVYSNEHTKSKAVSIFSNRYDIPYTIKVSPKNFSRQRNIQYVPLYAVFCI